jgi:hypothetical protein
LTKRRLLNAALVVVLVVLASVVALIWALGRGPDFYDDPALWDARALAEGADGFVRAVFEQQERVGGPGAFDITVTDDEANGLVAYATEPGRVPEPTIVPDPAWLEPLRNVSRAVSGPRVNFADGAVLVAGTRSLGPVSCVVSASVRIENGPDGPQAAVDWVRLGALPGPTAELERAVRDLLETAVRVEGRPVRVEGIEVSDGKLRVWGKAGEGPGRR